MLGPSGTSGLFANLLRALYVEKHGIEQLQVLAPCMCTLQLRALSVARVIVIVDVRGCGTGCLKAGVLLTNLGFKMQPQLEVL